MEDWPSVEVLVECSSPVADSVALTVAFGTAAPDGSVTVPLMAPRKVWLFAVTTTTRVRSNTDRHRFIYRFPLARSNSYQWPLRSRPLPPIRTRKSGPRTAGRPDKLKF